MNKLKDFKNGERLFTYKVACDAGNAPNPYGGVCTLAICKPKIRSVAKPGDVVVGFGCKEDERRIVYCMVIDESLTWAEYIKRCNSKDSDAIKYKIPQNENDQGDCIWRDATSYIKSRNSWSRHDGLEDFDRDVTNGKNVIIGSTFWYFGSPSKNPIVIPKNSKLSNIIPHAQGHRSTSNMNFRDSFVAFFNEQLIEKEIVKKGLNGTSTISPEISDERTCSDCRAAEKISDLTAEELD